MPALFTTTELESLQRRTQGATRERMLRELAEAVEVLSAERPLVLVLEDLHWSDVSTLDWLAFVARRREPARLLIIGTYRPVEVIVSNHSLKSVKQELQLHRQCVELPLSFLTEEHVAKYLVKRFAPPASAGKACPEQSRRGQGKGLAAATLHKLAHLIHQRTEGNPLFMVNLVDYVVTQGVLVRLDGQWTLQGEVTAVASWAPESLQQMIEQRLERVSSAERTILEVASVAGAEFSAVAVAAGVETTVEAVEERCAELARRESFLRACGTAEWPDGTVAARYGFLHAFYQEVLYERLPAGRRQRLHQRIGEREEQAYGERAREIAAELAMHFERGREYRKAVQYLQQAGETAVRRSANQEAIGLLTKGLELLQTLPDTPERTQQELRLQLTLGNPLIATKGYGVPEVEKVYTRARELCRQVGETPQLLPMLVGLRVFYVIRVELQTVRELDEQIRRLTQSVQDPTLLTLTYVVVLGETSFYLGGFASAREHFEQGIALYDPRQPRPSWFWIDPGVASLSYAAWVLWFLGYPDQALKRIHEALTLAQELSHPFTMAWALQFACHLHLLRREGPLAREQAEAVITLSTEQGFPFLLADGTALRGRALAEQGQVEEGIAQMRQGMDACRATGAEITRTAQLAWLAAAYARAGRVEEGLSLVAEALALVDKTGTRVGEAGLYVLKGLLTLKQFGVRSQGKASQNKSRQA